MKRVLYILIAILCMSFTPFVFAAEDYYHVYDETNTLSVKELNELDDYASEMSDKYDFEIVVMILMDTEGKPLDEYTREFYTNGRLNGGYSKDGILLLYDVGGGRWYICTSGEGVSIFPNSVLHDYWDIFESGATGYDSIKNYIDALVKRLDNETTTDIPIQTFTPLKSKERLEDEAGLLVSSQKSALLNKLNEISERQKFDIVVVTVTSLDGKTAKAFADDYFDDNGYGQGNNSDGILLLLNYSSKEWSISTHGYGKTAFTDYGQQKIMETLTPMLSDGNFNSAFNEFASLCDDYITKARSGNPVDIDDVPIPAEKNILKTALISVAIGTILAFIVSSSMKRSLVSVSMQKKADNYTRDNSMNITDSREIFLYKNVTSKTKSQSGGSTTNKSSSGREHGGSSGKF